DGDRAGFVRRTGSLDDVLPADAGHRGGAGDFAGPGRVPDDVHRVAGHLRCAGDRLDAGGRGVFHAAARDIAAGVAYSGPATGDGTFHRGAAQRSRLRRGAADPGVDVRSVLLLRVRDEFHPAGRVR